MLSVQPVNISARRVPFRGAEDPQEYIYSKEQFENDKSKIEESLETVNEIVENAGNSKAVRVVGKLASIGIGAALGFISLKFGAQGVAKLAKKGVAYAKNIATKPAVQEASKKTTETAERVFDKSKGLFKKIIGWAKNNKVVQTVVNFIKNLIEKVKNSKVAQNVSDFFKRASESSFGNKVKEVSGKIVNKAKIGVEKVKTGAKKLVTPVADSNVTPLENGVVNLFAVSGGVSGGITALQEATKEK